MVLPYCVIRNTAERSTLPAFIRFHVIDRRPFHSLVCSMRRMPSIALASCLLVVPAFAQTDSAPPKPKKTPTALPQPKAEPENPGAYAPPVAPEREGPSAADVGPVLKHFIRASTTDNLEETQNADNASLAVHEKIALDKRISVPLIHDVQNDGPNSNSENRALQYEVTYLNWGAVTQEQLLARRGHYFTITWENDGPKADFTARFEYREVRSKEIVRTLTQKMAGISGSTRSYFAVVDHAYQAYGPVVSWRFSVLKGDTVVAQTKSFIW
jgi:hypothetical protein